MGPSDAGTLSRARTRRGSPRTDGFRTRTGVLTFHRCINYGSYWQARCLVEGLRARGHDAVILDHDSWRINRAEWRCGLQPHRPERTSFTDSLRYGVKMLRFFRAAASLPRSARFPLEQPDVMEPFDVVVVGSDEVWNLAHPWYGSCPAFFGSGVRAARLVAYGATLGSHGSGVGEPWAARLRSFARISVRDEHSRRILASELGTEPALVLDPCLQFPLPPGGTWRGPQGPFLAVYGHGFSESFARRVRGSARARGLTLLSIGYRNDWADAQWLDAGPHDFAHALVRARAVATNFFHGCVFALRNEKPFVCEPMPYRSTKVRDLGALLGAEGHLVGPETPAEVFEERLSQPLAPGIRARIEDGRRASERFLAEALA